jgi:TonB family protein
LTVETEWDLKSAQHPKFGAQQIMRDSAGRERYEPIIVNGRPVSSIVHITDVVEGRFIDLDLSKRTALVTKTPIGQGYSVDLSTPRCRAPAKPNPGQNLLGYKEIAGVEAWGEQTLKTTALSDGTSITEDHERWHSTYYCMQVAETIRVDAGTTTQTIANFSSAEPDPALFQIPPGFTVSDAPPQTHGEPAPGMVRIGGDVSGPVVLKMSAPEFPEQARRANVHGFVLVYLVVDENGLPQDVKVIRGLGSGLDEKAVEAVRRYRFKAAMQHGMPVKVEMNVQVNFQVD